MHGVENQLHFPPQFSAYTNTQKGISMAVINELD